MVRRCVNTCHAQHQLIRTGTEGETGTAVARPTEGYDSEYVLPVDIGTPPQTIPLNLDTGSADL